MAIRDRRPAPGRRRNRCTRLSIVPWRASATAGAFCCGRFAGVGALAALPDVHVAFALLVSGSRTRLAFAPMGCARIGEVEAVLLRLWSDVASGGTDTARATLGLLVDEASVAPALAAIDAAASQLAAAGFDLSHLTTPSPSLSGPST